MFFTPACLLFFSFFFFFEKTFFKLNKNVMTDSFVFSDPERVAVRGDLPDFDTDYSNQRKR